MPGRRYLSVGFLILLLSVTTCSAPFVARLGTASIPFGEGPPGRWEKINTIVYYDIPTENLKGAITPAYLLYMVTVAGFHNREFGISAGPDDDVRYTVDGGEVWTRAEGELHCRHGLEIVDEHTAWHCGNGGMRVTDDGGRTWTTVTQSPCPILSFLDSQTGWAASPYLLQETIDGGESWTTLIPSVDEGAIAAAAITSPGTGYILDKFGALHRTADDGKTWETSSIGLAAGQLLVPSYNGPRAALRFVDERHGVLVYDLEDRSVWFAVTADGGQTWQREEIAELRDQATYFQVFLSQDGSLLTMTNDFNNGTNVSTVFRYVEE
jgi:photosystem II stability/assembly factor-like uncharacterized protein